jgi:hypothetical protein
MATTVYGSTIKGYWRVFLTYTFNGAYSETQASLSWSYGVNWVKQIKGNKDTDGNYQTEKDRPTYVSCTGQTTQYRYPTARLTKTWYNNGNRSYTYGSGTFYFTRTTVDQSITITASSYHNSSSTTYKGTSAKSVTFTVPARTAYTISFSANGGVNPPASVTKYYGYDITLPASTPTRDYWDFNKWNTNSSGTGTNYAPSTTYSGNYTTTLYATWSYINPIMNGFELERVDNDSTFSSNDEGGILKVKFNYTSGHRPSQPASEVTTTVTANINGISTNGLPVYNGTNFNSTSFTFSGTGTKTVYYNISSTDTSRPYTIVFTLVENGHTITTQTTLSSSLYPIELSPNGEFLSFGSNTRCKKKLYLLADDANSYGEGYNLWQVLNQLGWIDVMIDE